MKSNHIKDVISLGELIVKYKNWKFNIGTMLLGRILIFWGNYSAAMYFQLLYIFERLVFH